MDKNMSQPCSRYPACCYDDAKSQDISGHDDVIFWTFSDTGIAGYAGRSIPGKVNINKNTKCPHV